MLLVSPILCGEQVTDINNSWNLIQKYDANSDFKHLIGKKGSQGWELDYKRDRPGLALQSAKTPFILDSGLYRITFLLRRGHYPSKGFLNKTYSLFRLELWDLTTNELIINRELQTCDFSAPNVYEPRWMEFSAEGRQGHPVEARVYWSGLANGEIDSIEMLHFPTPPLNELEEKATRLSDVLEKNHLENGFVVSRSLTGEPDETGDATTYTGYYCAALAWKYAVTKDPWTYQALENVLTTLHNSIKGDGKNPILTRYVGPDETPFSKSPSKDVYNSFFLAYSVAYPHISNRALKQQMEDDLERLATSFIKNDLTIKLGHHVLMSLTPYFTEEEVKKGIREFLDDKKAVKKALRSIRLTKRYLPIAQPWPEMNQVVQAIKQGNEEKLFSLVVPTMNGLVQLVERAREILREQYRVDLFPKRLRQLDVPGRRLLDLTNETLRKLPPPIEGKRFQRLSDLKVLASNSVISLHMIRTALTITQAPQLLEYYKSNLFAQDELLKTALQWYGFEDRLIKLTSGDNAADQHRRGYLGVLALYNLIQLETNPATKENYREILKEEFQTYAHEDNPLFEAIALASGLKGNRDLILKDLYLYPEDRLGWGEEYWERQGKNVAQEWGGGENKGYSREALPISHRPKDSFLWQRNARRLRGDYVKHYPATDYLFLYWMCRYHEILPNPTPKPTVRKK
jgi:hypothetical protein